MRKRIVKSKKDGQPMDSDSAVRGVLSEKISGSHWGGEYSWEKIRNKE